MISKLGKHAAEVGTRLQMVCVQFDGGVVAFACGSQITRTVEQFRQHECHLCRRTVRLEHGAKCFSSFDKLACGFQICRKVEQFRHAVDVVGIDRSFDAPCDRRLDRCRSLVDGLQAISVKRKLQLAVRAHQPIATPDAQATAISDDPFCHACGFGSTARGEN